MNGEMHLACGVAVAARQALKSGGAFAFDLPQYVQKIEFQFLPEKHFFAATVYRAANAGEWFARCQRLGLVEICFMAPSEVKDRRLLGFAGAAQYAIVCAYSKRVTCWHAKWEFDSTQKAWRVLYIEAEWEGPPPATLRFVNNTQAFGAILGTIGEFARTIGCDGFAGIFQSAQAALDGGAPPENAVTANTPFSQLPQANKRLLAAAGIADVFGAMGSWNDSPPYMAHEKGLDKEYEAYSGELLAQVRKAILFAVNEW